MNITKVRHQSHPEAVFGGVWTVFLRPSTPQAPSRTHQATPGRSAALRTQPVVGIMAEPALFSRDTTHTCVQSGVQGVWRDPLHLPGRTQTPQTMHLNTTTFLHRMMRPI